jgi:hypothetical protein
MTTQGRTIFSFVMDHDPRFAYEAWHLARSLIEHCGGDPSSIHVQCLPEVNARRRSLFGEFGCHVHEIARFGDGRYCNKLNQLENLRELDFDRVVLLDTDMIATSDLRPFLGARSGRARGWNGDLLRGADPSGDGFDGRSVAYAFGELDQIVLAYATTIHKSQGSEYPAVVVPVTTPHYMMLQRKLLYTGVTRGKRLVILLGQKKAVAIAIKNVSGRRRWSKLREWLNPVWRGPITTNYSNHASGRPIWKYLSAGFSIPWSIGAWASPARIVNSASAAHQGARLDFDDLQSAKGENTPFPEQGCAGATRCSGHRVHCSDSNSRRITPDTSRSIKHPLLGTCSLVIMPWSQDQLAMSVVHLEKPKPRRQATSCLLRAPCSACDHLRLGRARLMAVGIDVGDSGWDRFVLACTNRRAAETATRVGSLGGSV